mmetsp:Transcript_22452/g.62276  ORF Transcript_22452/g.62276 Transcript_22452/m.62276 type:complete len:212 (-) Transcript_22452:90-725(-)|eukprot:CAMPEP_0117677900 /NCGR_PEP_ID=MMETSP0804-20121206/16989_1 /TAXON_ID=1074897 /ORGANISM="Tetraselmis astigmatica, Strain CCMP880" /LENGTH=211 /DNA_ID=CAMNT_0005487209 /DNA_START=224 /DNA_END=859 /DNA_ORIENTATION=+
MFILSKFSEEIAVAPSELDKSNCEAITSVINRDFIDKVIPDVGLVVSLWEIESAAGGTIHPSDGAAHYDVVFTVVVFRPFPGEVLLGRLDKSDRSGLHISLGFFKDVFVPESNLQDPSVYISEDTSGGVWRWDFEGTQLFLDPGEEVRVLVKEVRFNPIPTPAQMKEEGIGTDALHFKPMEVIGDMNTDGLGAVSWWQEAVPQDPVSNANQ